MEKVKEEKINIYRILAYFIIYSIVGFIVETLYALVVYGTLESRQGFLYGPFCPIYGVGALAIILTLKNLQLDVHKLFIGGFLVGGVTEYLVSLIGEYVLNVNWWDYSDRFLNINGRVCFAFCCFWGVLTVYLLKVLNPHIDKIIDKIKAKFNINILKKVVLIVTILMLIDGVITCIAENLFIAKTVVENNLPAKSEHLYRNIYDNIYMNKYIKHHADKFWNEWVMIKVYPNLRIVLKDDTFVYAKDYYKYVKPYYYKFEKYNR